MDRPTLQSVSQKSLRKGFLCMNHRIWRDSTKQLRDIYDNYENGLFLIGIIIIIVLHT